MTIRTRESIYTKYWLCGINLHSATTDTASHLKRMFKGKSDKGQAPATEEISKMQSEIGSGLPTFDELPSFHDFKGCAWEVWGKDDELGTINLLTPEVVARAAKEEIRCVCYQM